MEANEAMKAMAKRIAWETVLRVEGTTRENMAAAALAAIMETQEACAKLAEGWNRHPTTGVPHETSANIATAIRTGEHYALEGDRHG